MLHVAQPHFLMTALAGRVYLGGAPGRDTHLGALTSPPWAPPTPAGRGRPSTSFPGAPCGWPTVPTPLPAHLPFHTQLGCPTRPASLSRVLLTAEPTPNGPGGREPCGLSLLLGCYFRLMFLYLDVSS